MNKYILRELLNFINRINDFNIYFLTVTTEYTPEYINTSYTFTKTGKTGFIKCEIIENKNVLVNVQFQDEKGQSSGIVLVDLKEEDIKKLLNTLKECEFRKENILHWYTTFNNF